MSEKIEWLEWVDGEKKIEILSSADLLVLTSHNENFANIILESLALGTPVLISDQVGLCDYVKEHQLGWVCRMDEAAIRQTLLNAMQDSGMRNKIHREAPQWARKDFDPQRIARRYLKHYEEIFKCPDSQLSS